MDYKAVVSVDAIRGYIGDASIVAFDFESAPLPTYRDEDKAALDPHKSHIVGISLSVEEGTAIYVPLRHLAGDNADPAAVMAYLRGALFENPNVTKVAHNLAFESMFLYALGDGRLPGIVVQPPCYDTIAAAQLTLKGHAQFRELSDSGLKRLAASLLGVDVTTFGEATQGKHFDELNAHSPEAIQYACADSDYTLRLYHRFNAWFDTYLPGHRYIVEQVESPTAVYCGMMRYNGLLIDVDTMSRKQADAADQLAALRADIRDIIGDVDIGANASTQAFKRYLFEMLGLPVLKTTAKRKVAADDETLILLAEWCAEHRLELVPLFDLVQAYRKVGKISSTYIEGYLRYLNPVTGRIHPDMMPLATQTGRFAARNPNVQNQVAPGNDPIGVRNFVIAPEGYVLLEADYSQVELRIAAYLSRDRTMLAAYEAGQDIHAITTSAVFGISLEEASDKHHPEYKHRRTVAKGTLFGILYGIYAKGLMRNLKTTAGVTLSEAECRKYIDGIKGRYRRLAAWQQEAIDRARRRKYTETALGRRRYLPDICAEAYSKRGTSERMAINTPVQGLAADCLKLAMGRLTVALAYKPYIRPLITVHDSLVFEVRADKVEEATEVIRACMEAPPPLEGFMPLVAEVSVGERYGELE